MPPNKNAHFTWMPSDALNNRTILPEIFRSAEPHRKASNGILYTIFPKSVLVCCVIQLVADGLVIAVLGN